MKPKRIRLRREKGWRKPEGAIVVARPSKWGNPIRVGSECQISAHGEDGLSYEFGRITVTPEIAVAIFRADLEASLIKPDWPNVHPDDMAVWAQRVDGCLRSCRGHDLGCWCPEDQPCHADVLLEFANR